MNVGSFGGDPTRVTLIGHDTGAALVNLIFISPISKGKLFYEFIIYRIHIMSDERRKA